MDGGEKWQAILVVRSGAEGEHEVCADGQTPCGQCGCLSCLALTLLLPTQVLGCCSSVTFATYLPHEGRAWLFVEAPQGQLSSLESTGKCTPVYSHLHPGPMLHAPTVPAWGVMWCTLAVTPAVCANM